MDETTFHRSAVYAPRSGASMSFTTLITTDKLGGEPISVLCASSGLVWVILTSQQLVSLNQQGNITFTAGRQRETGYIDGQASVSKFNFTTLSDTCMDVSGNICVTDSGNHAVRHVNTSTNEVKTLAGGQKGCVDGKALDAKFYFPTSIVLTSLGFLMLCDSGNNRIRLIAEGMVYTVAGCGSTGHLDGSALDSLFNWPSGIQVTADGEILVADTYNHTIRYISDEQVSTVSGKAGINGNIDGHVSEATFSYPARLSWTQRGELLILDTGSNSLRVMSTDSIVSTLIGLAKPNLDSPNLLNSPVGIDCSLDGRIFIADKLGIHFAAWKDPQQLEEERKQENSEKATLIRRASTILAPSHLVSSKRKSLNNLRPTSPFHIPLTEVTTNPLSDSQSIPPPPPESPLASPKPDSTSLSTSEEVTGQLPEDPLAVFVSQVSGDSNFIRMTDLDGFDVTMATNVAVDVGKLAPRALSPPISPRVSRTDSTPTTPLPSSRRAGSTPRQSMMVSTNTDGNFLSIGVVSPEAAEIFDCLDVIHALYNACSEITSELLLKLKSLNRQIVRNFGTVLKRYQECVQSCPTESYLNSLVSVIEPLCQNILAIGSAMIVLEATPNGKTLSNFEQLAKLASSIKDGLSALEFTMSSQPEGSDTSTMPSIPLLADSIYSSRPGSGMMLSSPLLHGFESNSSNKYSMQELESSGKVSRWAPIRRSCGLFAASSGDVFATTTDHLVVKFESGGSMTVLAGLSGKGGYVNGAAVTAQFRFLRLCGLVQDSRSGGLILVDSGNHCLRFITSDYSNVTTFAGDAKRPGFKDGTIDAARFNTPSSVVQSPHGELFVADTGNNRIRLISNGIVSTIGGSGLRGSNDGPFLEASFRSPSGLCLSPDGDLYVADYHNHLIRKLSGGFVTTVAGDGTEGYVDGKARAARFANPISISMTPAGDLIVSDYYNHCLRCIANETVTTFAGVPKTQGNKNGFGLEASFTFPTELALLPPIRVPTPRHQTTNDAIVETDELSPPCSPRSIPSFSSARFIPPLQTAEAPSTAPIPASTAPVVNTTSRALLNSDRGKRNLTVRSSSSLPTAPSQPSLASGATALPNNEPAKMENRLLIADSTSIRMLNDFELPHHVFKGDISLSLVQMAWEGGHRYQPPSWIADAITALHTTGTVIRDLWTLSSELTHVRPIVERIVAGFPIDWYAVPPRVVATVLKAFFQKLPTPLLTMELQDIFITAAQPIYDSPAKRLTLLGPAVKALPVANRILLKRLVTLFKAFDDPLHIPPVWGPILLLRRSLGSFRDSMRASARVIAALIQHHAELFSGLDLLTQPPPFWLSRINNAEQVQDSFGPFIRSLLMTRDRLARVKDINLDIMELFQNVEMMRELLFALQEQFLNTPVLHVIERHHLLRFHAYLTSFQDAWVKLDEPSQASSSAQPMRSSSGSSLQMVSFNRTQHGLAANQTYEISPSGSRKVSELVSLFSSPSSGSVPSAKLSGSTGPGSAKTISPQESPASSLKIGTPGSSRRKDKLARRGSLAGTPDSGFMPLTAGVSHYAENTFSISDSESDTDVIAPMAEPGRRSRKNSKESKESRHAKDKSPPSSTVSSAPAELSPIQARFLAESRNSSPSKSPPKRKRSPDRKAGNYSPSLRPARTPMISEEASHVFGPVSTQDNADSPQLVVPIVAGVQPQSSESSEGNLGNARLSLADVEAKEEDQLLMGLMRTTKIRNQLDRLVLSALYELLLFSFSVDLAYRGALFANPQVVGILDTSRRALDSFGVRVFWKKLSDSPVVSWRTFKSEFSRSFPNTKAEEFVILKKVLDNHSAGLVSATHFAHFLSAFGPIHQCASRLASVYNAPWFKGYMTSAEAEHVLSGAAKNSFLIRFASTHPGSFALSYSTCEDPTNPTAEFEITHQQIELVGKEDGTVGFRLGSLSGLKLAPNAPTAQENSKERVRASSDDAKEVFSSLNELAQYLTTTRAMNQKNPDNVFLEPFCFGEISEAEANSILEMEALGTYLLRLQPRFRLQYRTIHGSGSPFSMQNVLNYPQHQQVDLNNGPSKTPKDVVGRSDSDSIEKSTGSGASESKKACPPGRYWISYIKNAVYASSSESSSLGLLGGSYLDQVGHIELKRDVDGEWIMQDKKYATLKELIETNKMLFVAPYTHLPSISPIMQDDQDDRSLVLSTILQDEEGEDGYAIDLRSAMIRPLPKTDETLTALVSKIVTSREAPEEADLGLLTDYLATVSNDATERLLRTRSRRGTSIFGTLRKDFLRTDSVRLEATNLPLFKLTTLTFSITAGDKPVRWVIPDASLITDYCFFACSPSEGALSKGESVTVKVSVVLFKVVAVHRLLRVLTFSSDAQFVTCLPVFVRTTADVAVSLLREPSANSKSAKSDNLGSFGNEEYWRIPPSALTDTTVIETGVSATVFRANLYGAFVVQKRFILRSKVDDPYTIDLKAFETELQVLRTVRHDNVAHFVGAWCDLDLNSVFIVLKYAEFGSIAHYLNVDALTEDAKGRPLSIHDQMLFEATSLPATSSSSIFKPPLLKRGSSNSGGSSSKISKSSGKSSIETTHPPETKTFAFKLSMALDAARAIHYLHRNNLLHRDIKTQNMLVDTHYRVQLADFGESRETATSMMTLGRGTPKYRAPELYTRVYNNKVDIFSLGLVMAEIFGGKLATIPGFVENDKPLLPPMPLGLPTAFISLLKACCLRNPSKRPTAKQVVQILNLIRKDVLDQEGHSRLSPRSRYVPK